MILESVRCGYCSAIFDKGINRPLLDILNEIKDGRWRHEIERLRSLAPSEYAREKKRLAAFMVSSETKNGGHKGEDLGTHSGLLQLDIDGLDDFNHAEETRMRLSADSHVLACWISPSGKGVKAIVPITPDHKAHRANFDAARHYFRESHQLEIDPMCSDPGRLCFVSYDPDLWLNQSAESFHAAPTALTAAERQPASGSSPSAASPSFILHHTIFNDFPGLKRLYSTFVERRVGNVQPGLRNAALTELVPLLYSAIAPQFILPFAEEFYCQHQAIFRDPIHQHLKEANALLEGCAKSFAVKRLTDREASQYSELNEREQTAFRICHALSRVEQSDCPPPHFFLSAENLGHRLGVLDMTAHRLLQLLCRRGIIEVTEPGTRRAKGQAGRATRYRWVLPTLSADDNDC
jgi:hypothetical protein